MDKRILWGILSWVGTCVLLVAAFSLKGLAYWAGITGAAAVIVAAATLVSPRESLPIGASIEDVRQLAISGQRMRALRWYRIITGASLKKAIEEVDRMTWEASKHG